MMKARAVISEMNTVMEMGKGVGGKRKKRKNWRFLLRRGGVNPSDLLSQALQKRMGAVGSFEIGLEE